MRMQSIGSKIIVALAALTCAQIAPAQNFSRKEFPGKEWSVLASPEKLGWSSAKLGDAEAYAATIATAAVMVVHQGVIVRQWGQVDWPYPCHSMRKSLLSGLIGCYVDEGKIELTKTLATLNINDKQMLTEIERTASIADLITSRSGVYLPAAYSPEEMTTRLPPRGSHVPGTYWYYNNWDFNALGTIFRQETGADIFEDFDRRVARPLGMQDYRASAQRYIFEDVSDHPAYAFRMSARDLARFGLLYARNGKWKRRQILSEAWVRDSVTPHVEFATGGYGYLWWTTRKDADELFGCHTEVGAFAASGSHGHLLCVLPKSDIVIVHRVNSAIDGNDVSGPELKTLIEHILAARPSTR